jgi:outer membrane receptor for ferrienterochelin and colicin
MAQTAKYLPVGNPDLKPEKSLSEEIALLWDNNNNLNAGITLFNTALVNWVSVSTVFPASAI